MTSTSPGGSLARSLASAAMSPVSTYSTILPSIVRADSGEPRRLAVDRELRDRNRGVADPRGGATVGREPEGVGAVELQHVGQKLEALGQLGVRRQLRGHGGDDTRVRLVVCVPTYNERENLEPMVDAARRGARRPSSRTRTCSSSTIPRRTAPASSPTGSRGERRRSWTSSTATRKEGLGPAYVAGFDRALGDGAELVVHDRLRLLARPGRSATPRRRRPRVPASPLGSRYVAGRRHGELGQRCGSSSAAAAPFTPARSSASLCATRPRVQSLAPRGARGAADPSRIESSGYAFQIETAYRAAPGRLRPSRRFRSLRGRRTEGGRRWARGIVLEAIVRRCPSFACAPPGIVCESRL